MNKSLEFAYAFFVTGILFDLGSTILGVSLYDIQEANPLGLLYSFAISLLAILLIYHLLNKNETNNKLKLRIIKGCLYTVGLLRLVIGLLNLYFI